MFINVLDEVDKPLQSAETHLNNTCMEAEQ